MNILIIANRVGHEVQKPRSAEDDSARAELKQKFEQMLMWKITEHGVQFIGEEADFDRETIAKNLGVQWANIDMPQGERETRGIAEEQRKRIHTPSYLGLDARTGLTADGYQRDVGNGWVELEPRLPSDTIREEYMFDRVIKEAEDAQSIIVICGVIHSEELGRRFRQNLSNKVEVETWPPR